jgi:divalent metal cation (Fe/Co/Zn/Cd) transporter
MKNMWEHARRFAGGFYVALALGMVVSLFLGAAPQSRYDNPIIKLFAVVVAPAIYAALSALPFVLWVWLRGTRYSLSARGFSVTCFVDGMLCAASLVGLLTVAFAPFMDYVVAVGIEGNLFNTLCILFFVTAVAGATFLTSELAFRSPMRIAQHRTGGSRS